jgi:hypothetical protein
VNEIFFLSSFGHSFCHLSFECSPDFNPIETLFSMIKNWCRLNSDQLRSRGVSDEDILHLSFQANAAHVYNLIMGHEYDLTEF